MEIIRKNYLNEINELLKFTPVVALIGPRQVGKTTLARMVAQEYPDVTFFDLENPASLSRLSDPLLALQFLTGLIVIDEIQHQPNLFEILRFLVDEPDAKQRFLILGSASPKLLQQTSESLAGRIAYVEIQGFSLQEIGATHANKLWFRGAFPRSYLAPSEAASIRWREEFIRTFLERDLPQLGIKIPAITMRRFWMMLAHYHGQIWNSAEFARAFGMSDKIVRHYLDILTSTFIVRQLSPWWENISKRQVKASKIFLNDSGLLHTLLGLNTKEELESHPKVGASWEGFAMNTVMTQLRLRPEESFFWSTYTGAELDLVVIKGNIRLGFEFKRTSAPTITRSMIIALKDLNLSHIYIVHAGSESYPLEKNITALCLSDVLTMLKPFNEL
jgi:predicted AAA+ superfamily ATPase